MKFYIASRLENYPVVQRVRNTLIEVGHTFTYDWTVVGAVRGDAAKIRAVAERELEGVRACDVFILLLPAGRGAHVELGAALALGKPTIIYREREPYGTPPSADPLGTGQATSAFYHHPLVVHIEIFDALYAAVARLASAIDTPPEVVS